MGLDLGDANSPPYPFENVINQGPHPNAKHLKDDHEIR